MAVACGLLIVVVWLARQRHALLSFSDFFFRKLTGPHFFLHEAVPSLYIMEQGQQLRLLYTCMINILFCYSSWHSAKSVTSITKNGSFPESKATKSKCPADQSFDTGSGRFFPQKSSCSFGNIATTSGFFQNSPNAKYSQCV